MSFEIKQSWTGNIYAKFLSVVNRNQSLLNTEDRELWYAWGEHYEEDFIERVAPILNVDIRLNPEKEYCKWAIDLFDYTNYKYADLKVQEPPFFSAGNKKYMYRGGRYNPSFTVIFNKKDYENYIQNYPDCDIYYWVNWKQLNYSFSNGYIVNIRHIQGVWRAAFPLICEMIQQEKVSLHAYKHRTNDDHNARERYLFLLNDSEVFLRLL